MKDQWKFDIKDRGFEVNKINKEEPLNNKKAKYAKRGGEKLRSWEYENHSVKNQNHLVWKICNLVWKIYEVGRGKGSNIMKLRCATCLEKSWTNL